MVLFRFIFVAMCLVTSGILAADEWWEYGHFYQIYPRSFQDSDGDGIGDLNGITLRLDYLKLIGVTGIWLSPIFKSPMKDLGYDISDYYAIQPEYGTMEDFDRLVAKCNTLGIKLILDFVPNHTSDEHEWFKKSIANDPEYKDFYVWSDGKSSNRPPSNWVSKFGGSAWELNTKRNQYYLHQFLKEQPDLNYENLKVQNAMKDVLRFWLKKGVSGFRCDAVPFLVEKSRFSIILGGIVYDDEDQNSDCSDKNSYDCFKHDKTLNLDETYNIVYEWRAVMEEDEFKALKPVLMTEANTDLSHMVRYYGKSTNGAWTNGAQMPFNFLLLENTNALSKASDFKKYITDWINGMKQLSQPANIKLHANWLLGNHDVRRVASRYGPLRTDIFNILLKTLPGITVTYNGEEIGMTDVHITYEQGKDTQACNAGEGEFEKITRDPARTPFQWNDQKNAGFSFADKTWLPVADNYTSCNVNLQQGVPKSHLSVFRKLIFSRVDSAMKYGGLKIDAVNDNVLVYTREQENVERSKVFLIILNIGNEDETIHLQDNPLFKSLPRSMEVIVTSIESKYNVGDIINVHKGIAIQSRIGLVLYGTKN